MPGIGIAPSFEDASLSRPRSVVLVVTLWLFGLATSLFLVGMWGRTVAVDQATVEESTRAIIDSEVAADRIDTWFEEGLAAVSGVDSETARSIAQSIEGRQEYQSAVDSIVAAFVASLFAEAGDTTSVDLDATLTPLVPIVATEFARRDVPVEAAQIEDLLDDAGVVALDAGDAASLAAVVNDARVFLSKVVVISLLALVVTGSGAVILADNRLGMVRQLSTRIVLAALSYAVILRLASWALDPERGRSPFASGIAVLLKSNTQVFVLFGVVAAIIAGMGTAAAWRKRRDSEPPRAAHDETRELVSIE